MDERFEPAIAAVPADMAAKLEPAELYHQILEHRWFLSERAGFDVGMAESVASYVRDVLAGAPAEQAVHNDPPPPTLEIPVIGPDRLDP